MDRRYGSPDTQVSGYARYLGIWSSTKWPPLLRNQTVQMKELKLVDSAGAKAAATGWGIKPYKPVPSGAESSGITVKRPRKGEGCLWTDVMEEPDRRRSGKPDQRRSGSSTKPPSLLHYQQ